jgi:catabolite regulation protein CreA
MLRFLNKKMLEGLYLKDRSEAEVTCLQVDIIQINDPE